MKKFLIGVVVVLLIAAAVVFGYLPWQVGSSRNKALNLPPYQASDAAKELHNRLLVADLHADTLLWSRDLLKRGSWGHVDLPRLQEGNVAVQAFTVVTKTPRDMNIESNAGDTDNITLLGFIQLWPTSTWSNLTERALHQARRLHQAAEKSNGKLVVLKTKNDVMKFLERRKTEKDVVAGFLGIEGAHALGGDVNNFDRLYDAGFRMIGMAHFFDNEMSGSAHGVAKYGLTDAGKKLVQKMQERGVFIDLAHASPQTIDNVLDVATRPIIVSHTGVKGTCNNTRNLNDEQLKRIGLTGGLVGIGFWDTATCGNDAKAIAKAIRYTVDLIGVDHVALGSDFDGSIDAPFDATGLVQITDALLQEGFDEAQIRKIMGENVIRTLQFFLP